MFGGIHLGLLLLIKNVARLPKQELGGESKPRTICCRAFSPTIPIVALTKRAQCTVWPSWAFWPTAAHCPHKAHWLLYFFWNTAHLVWRCICLPKRDPLAPGDRNEPIDGLYFGPYVPCMEKKKKARSRIVVAPLLQRFLTARGIVGGSVGQCIQVSTCWEFLTLWPFIFFPAFLWLS